MSIKKMNQKNGTLKRSVSFQGVSSIFSRVLHELEATKKKRKD